MALSVIEDRVVEGLKGTGLPINPPPLEGVETFLRARAEAARAAHAVDRGGELGREDDVGEDRVGLGAAVAQQAVLEGELVELLGQHGDRREDGVVGPRLTSEEILGGGAEEEPIGEKEGAASG